MTKIARDYTAKAVAIVNAGAAIKVRIKEANEDLARAYDVQKQVIMNACLDLFRAAREDGKTHEEINAMPANALYYAMPDLHVFKAKHADAIRAVFTDKEDVIAAIEELVELRAGVKAAEVIKFERKEQTVEEKIKDRVLKNFAEVAADRRAQFNWAAEIIREMNKELPYEADKGLLAPINCRPVYCMNYAGTAWVRIDWYFRGEKMAMNVILAAVGKIADEKKGK